MNVVYQISIGSFKQIGSTCNLKTRMQDHLRELKKGSHHNSKMQNVYDECKDFSYVILVECSSREDAFEKEQELLDIHFKKDGYLMMCAKAMGSGSGDKCVMFGKKRPDQSDRMRSNNPMKNPITKRLVSKKHKELFSTLEMRKKCSESWTEKKRATQSKKLSGSNNGRAQKVKCLESQKIFLSLQEAATYFKRSSATIASWNRQKIKVKYIYDK